MSHNPTHDRSEDRATIAVFGGTGFLGRRIVRHLLEYGCNVRAASRHPDRVETLFGAERPGLEAVRVDVHDDASIASALAGTTAAVNVVSLYVERGRETFQAVHVEAAARLARRAREAGVEGLVHVSGIGADPDSASPYIAARGRGEAAVRQAFPEAIIIRPAVMFGPDDAFLTTLVRLIRILPVSPLFGRGETRLQPVYVEDVAVAISRLLQEAPGARHTCYEFGGPRIYTYVELLRSIADRLGIRRRFVSVPFMVWETLARMAEYVPVIPLTRHQIALLQHDTIASHDLPGMRDLGIQAVPMEDIVTAIAGDDEARRG